MTVGNGAVNKSPSGWLTIKAFKGSVNVLDWTGTFFSGPHTHEYCPGFQMLAHASWTGNELLSTSLMGTSCITS